MILSISINLYGQGFLTGTYGKGLIKNKLSKIQKKDSVLMATKGKLKFVITDYNLGRVDRSKPLKFGFAFRNVGGRPIEIKKIVSSCSCEMEYPHGMIEPNGEGIINITYRTQDLFFRVTLGKQLHCLTQMMKRIAYISLEK